MGQKSGYEDRVIFFGATAVDGKIYAVGGMGNNFGLMHKSAEMYDQEKDEWQKKADMSIWRDFHCVEALNGKIYAMGGMLLNNTWLTSIEEYDPEEDEWTKKKDMPTGRSCSASTVLDGKIFLIGGWKLFVSFADVYSYDPINETCERKADLPFASDSGAACALNGKIYFMGGSSAGGGMVSYSQYGRI